MNKLGWFGSIAGILGAAIVASNISISGWGWVVFLISSISWLIVGFKRKDWALFYINLAFTATNTLGIIRYLF